VKARLDVERSADLDCCLSGRENLKATVAMTSGVSLNDVPAGRNEELFTVEFGDSESCSPIRFPGGTFGWPFDGFRLHPRVQKWAATERHVPSASFAGVSQHLSCVYRFLRTIVIRQICRIVVNDQCCQIFRLRGGATGRTLVTSESRTAR
jgi:hypothetical protein